MSNELERITNLLIQHIEVIQQEFKFHENGISENLIRPNCLYVVNWCPDEPDKVDGIKVERVINIIDGVVTLEASLTDLETFASIVVGGPYQL